MSNTEPPALSSEIETTQKASANATHDEKPQDITAITSAFANLTRGQAIKKFWRLYATVLLTAFGAM